MKQKRNILSTALVASVLVAFTARGSEVDFHPAASSTLTKTFLNQAESTLEDMTLVQNGQEMDASMMGIEMTMTTEYRMTVTDEYVAVDGPRPTKLVRAFDDIALSTTMAMSSTMMGDSNMEMTGKSELKGSRVLFTWNPESEEYDASYPEGVKGDEELLEGLDQNMDLAGLLPTTEVAEGDTWSIDPQALRPCFAPGGNVKLDIETPEDDMMGMGSQPTPDQYIGDFEGELSGKFAGTREEEGVEVAVIQLTVDITSNKDLSDLAGEMMSEAMKEQGMEMEMESMDSEFAFEGEGELLWNLKQGIIHSLELSGEASQTIDMAMNISVQGQEMAIEQSMSFGGNTTISVTTEQSS